MGKLECWHWSCARLNFSSIPGNPNKDFDADLFDPIGLFHRYHKSALSNSVSFIKIMNESHIVYEDVWMHNFLCTFEDKATDWFYDLGEEPITTFADFLRIFLKHWDPHYEEEEYEKIIEDIIAAMPKKGASIASHIEDQALMSTMIKNTLNIKPKKKILMVKAIKHQFLKTKIW